MWHYSTRNTNIGTQSLFLFFTKIILKISEHLQQFSLQVHLVFPFTKNNHFKGYHLDFDIRFRKRQRLDFALNWIEVRPRIKKKKILAIPNICHSVQLLSCVWLIASPWTAAHQASLSYRQLPAFTQTHVHWVIDAIQPSHPLSSPSPPAFNLSQHQGLFKWVSFSHQVAKILEFQLQHQSFQWIFITDFL